MGAAEVSTVDAEASTLDEATAVSIYVRSTFHDAHGGGGTVVDPILLCVSSVTTHVVVV